MQELINLIPEEVRNLVLVTPLAITILICISAGAALKRAHFFADERIPFWLGPLGGVVYALMAWQLNQDYRASMWALNVALGVFAGWNSVGIHQVIRNSPLLSKFPLLKLLVPPTGNTEFTRQTPEA